MGHCYHGCSSRTTMPRACASATIFNDTTCGGSDSVVISQRNMGPIRDACTSMSNGSYNATLETLDAANNLYLLKDECYDVQCTNCSVRQVVVMDACQTDTLDGIQFAYTFQFGSTVQLCGHKGKNAGVVWDGREIVLLVVGIVALLLLVLLLRYAWHSRCKSDKAAPRRSCKETMTVLCRDQH